MVLNLFISEQKLSHQIINTKIICLTYISLSDPWHPDNSTIKTTLIVHSYQFLLITSLYIYLSLIFLSYN